MKIYAVLLMLLLTVATANTVKDKTVMQSKIREVGVPRDVVMPLSAYQPDCPLKLIFVRLNKSFDGGAPYPIIRLQNIGNKPIRAYNIAYLIPGGTGGAWTSKGERILPGELIPEKKTPAANGDLQLTDSLRRALKLEGPMQAVWVFMVVRVEFEDGSIFEDEKGYGSLKDYFENLDIKKPH